jgi:hypothetical protein
MSAATALKSTEDEGGVFASLEKAVPSTNAIPAPLVRKDLLSSSTIEAYNCPFLAFGEIVLVEKALELVRSRKVAAIDLL